MVKYKKKYYRRYYKTNLQKVMRNYFKMRFDFVDRLGVDQSAFKFISWNTNTKSLQSVLNACADWPKAAALFHSFKLTGLAIEIIPGVRASDFYARGSYVMGLLTSSDVTDFNNLVEAKSALVLNYNQAVRKYLSFYGGETSWISTSDLSQLDGKFFAETNALAESGGFVWTVKFSFYVTFKNSN